MLRSALLISALAAGCAVHSIEAGGCSTAEYQTPPELIGSAQLLRRVAELLRCPNDQVRTYLLGPVENGMRAFEGCGQRVTFVNVCPPPDGQPSRCGWSRLCDWMGSPDSDRQQLADPFVIP